MRWNITAQIARKSIWLRLDCRNTSNTNMQMAKGERNEKNILCEILVIVVDRWLWFCLAAVRIRLGNRFIPIALFLWNWKPFVDVPCSSLPKKIGIFLELEMKFSLAERNTIYFSSQIGKLFSFFVVGLSNRNLFLNKSLPIVWHIPLIVFHISLWISIPQTVTPITNAHLRSLETLKKCRGESYMARDGRFRKAKTIGPVCKQCIFKCTENISDEHRKLLFNNFYNLGSIKKQWEYIGQCTDRVETKYRPTADNSMRKRSERNLLAYYFELDFGRVRVCKTFLMNTLAISNSVIKTVLRKLNENGELMSGDRRGNYDRRRLYNKSNWVQYVKFVFIFC